MACSRQKGDAVNYNQIKWFCAAFEMRSFSKAAEASFVTRQALGKAIKGLEAELGAPLFERSEFGVVPTEVAEAVYPLAINCLDDMQEIERTARSFSSSTRPLVTIAAADGTITSLPDDFFMRLEKACPRSEILVEKHSFTRCLELMREGNVDFALCPDPIGEGEFSRVRLVDERVFVAARNDLLRGVSDDWTLESLASLPFFSLGDKHEGCMGLASIFEEHGIETHINDRYTNYEIVLRKMRAGEGAVLVPETVCAEAAGDDVAMLPFPEGLVTWKVFFLYRPGDRRSYRREIVRFMHENSR